MFVALGRLVARRREVAAIGRELRAGGAAHPGERERELAAQVRELKLRLAAATGSVTSCSGCARGKPGERGGYAGGDCCSGRTELVFSADEVAALADAGTRAGDLRLPRGEQAGCAFRGPTGCALPIAHRPAICVRYACNPLQRELAGAGRLDEVERLAIDLRDALAAHAAAAADRRAGEWAEAVVRSVLS